MAQDGLASRLTQPATGRARSRQMPGGRTWGTQARAERPRSALAGNPGLELFFFFEPASDGLSFAAVVVLADPHSIDACGASARRGHKRAIPFRGEALRDAVRLSALFDRGHLHHI